MAGGPFGSTESPPGTLDRAHHHPRFDGWEPSRRHFVAELSADPLSWLADQLADPAAVLARAGVDADEVTEADKTGLAAAAPEIVAAVKRMLDGVRDGELAPTPAEPVAPPDRLALTGFVPFGDLDDHCKTMEFRRCPTGVNWFACRQDARPWPPDCA